MYKDIVATGDCNTLGAKHLTEKAYPELVGQEIAAKVLNLGHTMATTREGIKLLRENLGSADCVLIQFGLVDSYLTFKYSPYVLYYPDNLVRKLLRSIVKKYKKICRKIGFNEFIGEKSVVDINEYEKNIRDMVELTAPITTLLIETIPNHQIWRNAEIKRYNRVLHRISNEYSHCGVVPVYEVFLKHLDVFYMDETHCNEEGYQYIASRIMNVLQSNSTQI